MFNNLSETASLELLAVTASSTCVCWAKADAVFFDTELSARQKAELLNSAILEGRAELIPRVEALQKHFS